MSKETPSEPSKGNLPPRIAARPISVRPVCVTIRLDAILNNIMAVRSFIGAEAACIAVVKANAYGHGLVPAARAALSGGAAALAVAIPEEGIALRAAGVEAPILVMGCCAPEAADDLVRFGLDAALSTRDLLRALQRAASEQGRPARVHVKVDSGMGRVGVLPEEAPGLFSDVAAASGVEWAGLMTHFATADDDPCFAAEQWERFAGTFPAALAIREGPGPLHVHAANSAAVCTLPRSYRDLPDGMRPLVRTGLLTYGVPPVASGPMPEVSPALSLTARVTQAKDVPAGTTVSYGATYITKRPSRLALLSLGYADGYSRALSNRAQILLRGRRVPLAGRVCMDQIVIDATDTGAEIGDEAVLIGRQGDDEITVDDLAAWGGTVNHEVLARLGPRLPREYV